MKPPLTGAADSSDDYADPRRDVLLNPSEDLAGPDRYPRMWNMSAGMAVIRPDTPDRPEYVSVPMPSSTTTDLETRGARIFAVARWNALWEAAQFRRRFFHDDTDADADDFARLPPDLARIADLGDNNIVFIPRTQTRYYDYAPSPLLQGHGVHSDIPRREVPGRRAIPRRTRRRRAGRWPRQVNDSIIATCSPIYGPQGSCVREPYQLLVHGDCVSRFELPTSPERDSKQQGGPAMRAAEQLGP